MAAATKILWGPGTSGGLENSLERLLQAHLSLDAQHASRLTGHLVSERRVAVVESRPSLDQGRDCRVETVPLEGGPLAAIAVHGPVGVSATEGGLLRVM